jgi:CheY-like chemotaxis protein
MIRNQANGAVVAHPTRGEAVSSTLRVLVVAGDDMTRMTTALLLRACTAGDVLEASTGREALDTTLNGFVPDVLLLDTRLGDPSTSETCRRLRALPRSAPLDIWLLAPPDSSTQVLEALEAGADDLLNLPLAPHLLQARLQAASSRRQRARSSSRLLESLLAAQAEGTGELVIRETKSRRFGRVYFHGGRVVWVHVGGDTSTLAELLTGVAAIDEKAAQDLLEECRQGGIPVSIALERWGIIERARWRSCLQTWAQQRLRTLADFAASTAVFLPQEFHLEDDVSFTVSELASELDGRHDGTPWLASSSPNQASSRELSPPTTPDPQVETVLRTCMESGLAQSVAVLERDTGLCLGARGDRVDPIAVRSNLDYANAVALREGLDSCAVTTELAHQLTVPLAGQPGWVVYASYSRSQGPIGVAYTDFRLALARLSQRAVET